MDIWKIWENSFDKLIWMWDNLWRIAAPEIDMVYGYTPKLIEWGIKWYRQDYTRIIKIKTTHPENMTSLSLPLSVAFCAVFSSLHPSPPLSLLVSLSALMSQMD